MCLNNKKWNICNPTLLSTKQPFCWFAKVLVRVDVKKDIVSKPQHSLLGNFRCRSDQKTQTTTIDVNFCGGAQDKCPAVDNSNGHYEAMVLPENLKHFYRHSTIEKIKICMRLRAKNIHKEEGCP